MGHFEASDPFCSSHRRAVAAAASVLQPLHRFEHAVPLRLLAVVSKHRLAADGGRVLLESGCEGKRHGSIVSWAGCKLIANEQCAGFAGTC
jgi:hypothetical protein